MFENNWIDLIEEHLKNEKYFIDKHQNLLLSKISSAKDTLNIMSENKYLNRKFPQLKNESWFFKSTFKM